MTAKDEEKGNWESRDAKKGNIVTLLRGSFLFYMHE